MKTEPARSNKPGARRDLLAFFLTAFAISWSAMLLWHVPADSQGDKQDQVLKAFERVSFFYAFGPFLSAVGVSLLFYGRPGLKSLFKPVLKWRVGCVWYAWALFLPVANHNARRDPDDVDLQ
jgi:hypothetical protein